MPQEILKSIKFHKMGDALEPGSWIVVSEPTVFVGLGWDFSWKESFDLDASVTGFDIDNEVIEYIYFQNKLGLNGSVKHYGDNLTGEGSGDDEVIQINLNQVPEKVHYLTVTINSYHGNSLIKAKKAFIRLYTKKDKIGKYLLNRTKDCVGLLLGVFERDSRLNIWYFRVMADPIEGKKVTDSKESLQKLLGSYSINNYNINEDLNKKKHPYPDEELFKLNDWIKLDSKLIFVGLGWNLQKGFNFDLDASILTFDGKNNILEIIYHKNLQSKNGSIIHKGDNKTGEGEGDV
jgi:tellurium resistance protein TerZ